MKKLTTLCFLFVSLTISAQFIENRSIDFSNVFKKVNTIENFYTVLNSIVEIEEEEEDEPFDFDVKDYLPQGFNPFIAVVFKAYTGVYGAFFEEEDEDFLEFVTKEDYLPVSDDTDEMTKVMEEYELLTEEEDAPFEFDTKDYLPENFDTYEMDKLMEEYELLSEEEDEAFDFDTKKYLPNNS
ncbi:MAG: hypothetical protein ABFR05_05310 [Bacteroidota bacterium]